MARAGHGGEVDRPPAARGGRGFVIRGPARDALKAHLQARRIGTEIYYPVPFHQQACFESVTPPGSSFPVAEQAARTSLALPIFGELTAAQQRHVVASIAEFYARQ